MQDKYIFNVYICYFNSIQFHRKFVSICFPENVAWHGLSPVPVPPPGRAAAFRLSPGRRPRFPSHLSLSLK